MHCLKDALILAAQEEIWALRHALSEGVKSGWGHLSHLPCFTRDQVICV